MGRERWAVAAAGRATAEEEEARRRRLAAEEAAEEAVELDDDAVEGQRKLQVVVEVPGDGAAGQQP